MRPAWLFAGALALLAALLAVTLAATVAALDAATASEDRYALLLLVFAVASTLAALMLKWAMARYVGQPLQLGDEARLMLEAHRSSRLQLRGGAWDGLVAALNALADQRDALERDVQTQIREAKTTLEEEKNRLAALMSELSQSVVVCNLDGRILLYNGRARREFELLHGAEGEAAALLGLGRSIFAVFARSLIAHALESLQQQLERALAHPLAQFVTTSANGQLVRVQMAPVRAAGEEEGGALGGYVLIFDNITREVESEGRRDFVLQQLTEGSRAALANIRAAVENLQSYPEMESDERERFLAVIGEEVGALGGRLDQTMSQHADTLKARWPLEDMLASDLVAAAQRRIEARLGLATRVDALDPALWLKVESYSLIQALTYVATRLQESFSIRLLRFRLTPGGRLAHLDLLWSGAAVSTEALVSWENEPMALSGEETPLTLRDVVDRHGGELWFQRERASQQAYFRLLLPVATPRQASAAAAPAVRASRPEYYDFDLFKRTGQDHALDERSLTDLSYTVFDTETTGLQPSAGDEIIQIGAVRLVNGRLLRQESYEQLVDPRRPLRPESVAIHGIRAEMLAGAPTLERVLPTFHRFCEDTVLVAHNAAFDLRFLQLKEQATGIRFTQPVLDTLLLSALIHPNHDAHRLEAIAERLGVPLLGRHTALGDAIVTAEVFLKMIPLLNALGIVTLRQALAAAQETYYARLRY